MDQELIVARWQEDIRWVLDSPVPVSLYNHGPKLTLDHPNVDVIDLPNRGREAGIFLHHICQNWDHLADVSYFVQGDPHQPIEEVWKRLAIDYHGQTVPLTKQYMNNFPSKEVKALDRVEWFDAMEVHWGLADRFGGRSANLNQRWLANVWKQFFTSPQPDPWWFGYCASYSVSKERIRSRPLSYWTWLRDLALKDDNTTEFTTTSAWAFESVLYYLFSDPSVYIGREIPQPRQDKLVSRKTSACGCAKQSKLTTEKKRGSFYTS